MIVLRSTHDKALAEAEVEMEALRQEVAGLKARVSQLKPSDMEVWYRKQYYSELKWRNRAEDNLTVAKERLKSRRIISDRWERQFHRLEALRNTSGAYRPSRTNTGSGSGFTQKELDSMLRLCHPDKHPSNTAATGIFQKLKEMRG